MKTTDQRLWYVISLSMGFKRVYLEQKLNNKGQQTLNVQTQRRLAFDV